MSSQKELVIYYGNWDIYASKFFVASMDPKNVSTIVYSFMNVDQQGNLVISDSYADLEMRFITPGTYVGQPDSWNDNPPLPYYGNFNQLKKLKAANPSLRVEIGIGGWTFGKNFSSAVSPANQANFVRSIQAFLKKYTFFDGIVVDWEYPSSDGKNYGNPENACTPQDAQNFINFAKLVNQAKIDISSCFPSDPAKLTYDITPLINVLRRFDIMTYDFSSGAWGDKVTAHNSNLRSTSYTAFSVDKAVTFYLQKGVPASKLMIGGVGYSRGYANTDGPGKPCSGNSTDTTPTSEPGVVELKNLPCPGGIEYYDPLAGAAYTYDPVKRLYNSYDNVISCAEKALYVNQKNLRGIIVWQMNQDFAPSNTNAIFPQLYKGLMRQDYTFSKVPIIQKGFFQGVSVPKSGLGTTTPPAPPSTPVTPPSDPSKVQTFSIGLDTSIFTKMQAGQTTNNQAIVVGSEWQNHPTQNYYTRLIFQMNAMDVLSIPENGTKTMTIQVQRLFK